MRISDAASLCKEDVVGRMSHADPEKFEEKILETVNDLGRDLKINIHPNRVLWYLRGVVAPSFMKGLASDQCDFDGGTVMLPKPLRDNLSPEEWKPLLASQLIYERRSNMRTFARWLVSVSFLLMWGFAALVLAGAYGDYGLALALSLLIPIAILDTWFFSHELRNVRLDADEKAARLVGTREFLDVLEKVDSLRIWDIEERKKGGFRVTISSHFPAIDARIRRVRKLVEP